MCKKLIRLLSQIDEIVENALKAKRQGHQSGDTASSTSLNEKEDTISLEASHTKVSWQEEVESNGLVRFENLRKFPCFSLQDSTDSKL